jgi:hypothetical protein
MNAVVFAVVAGKSFHYHLQTAWPCCRESQTYWHRNSHTGCLMLGDAKRGGRRASRAHSFLRMYHAGSKGGRWRDDSLAGCKRVRRKR